MNLIGDVRKGLENGHYASIKLFKNSCSKFREDSFGISDCICFGLETLFIDNKGRLLIRNAVGNN